MFSSGKPLRARNKCGSFDPPRDNFVMRTGNNPEQGEYSPYEKELMWSTTGQAEEKTYLQSG